MSQHCRANPCCGERPCEGVPLPQHASGYPSRNLAPAPTEAPPAESQAAEIARLRNTLQNARITILDLKNARGSEAEGSDEEWVSDIDAALAAEGSAE